MGSLLRGDSGGTLHPTMAVAEPKHDECQNEAGNREDAAHSEGGQDDARAFETGTTILRRSRVREVDRRHYDERG